MELNRDQIVKALEHCINDATCEQCNLSPSTCHIEEDAIALIKELTEENERLRAEVSVKKKLLDKCVDLEDKVRADTVRKMQVEINKTLSALCKGDVSEIRRIVDQIAKEMLEGGDKQCQERKSN